MNTAPVAPKPLSLHLLEELTNDFSPDRKLGGGTYGDVYLGEHKNGEKIAVKVLKEGLDLNDEEFQKEYHNLANLHHENVVRLVGYCHETKREFVPYKDGMVFAYKIKRMLCFDYMHNGSLDSFIYDEFNDRNWCTRYAIIKGICKGLEYLHEKLKPPMYHLDLKPANILLDENMSAKIADFGLSRLLLEEKTRKTNSALGTVGYIPPEYINEGLISIKFDIFSLGVVIIKIMTGREGYFRVAEMSSQQFIELVHTNWMNRLQVISDHIYSVQVRRCIEIALSCVEADRHKRPCIGVIVNTLNKTESCVQILDALRNDSASSINQLGQLDGRLLVGMMVDPLSLVTAILTVLQLIRSAASTARQNKEKCLEFAERVKNLGDVLPSLTHAAGNDAATARVLERLKDAFGEALTLIQSCRSAGTFSGKYSSRKAGDLDSVDKRINNCVMDLSLLSNCSHEQR